MSNESKSKIAWLAYKEKINEWLKVKLKTTDVPPFIWTMIWIPVLLFFPFTFISSLFFKVINSISWWLGIWKCQSCNKFFWIFTPSHHVLRKYEVSRYGITDIVGRRERVCEACKVMLTLEEDN